MKPVISVIVPVYKVEEYLGECIDSILNQTFEDFELILVDDGSPDSCGDICDAYSKQDDRIKVIHQNNGGLSAARNAGIDISKGEYLTFIDSDDTICNDYLAILYSQLVEYQADISIGRLSNDQNESESALLLNGTDICIALYDDYSKIPISACAKLYRRELFDDLRFPPGKLHEDQMVVPILLYKASKVVLLSKVIYNYRVREDSIMHKMFTTKRFDDIDAIDYCIDFFKAKGEHNIEIKARKRRMEILCIYNVYATRDNAYIPDKYKISISKSLKYLKKNVDERRYEYYLAQVYPNRAIRYEYRKKLKSLLFKKEK